MKKLTPVFFICLLSMLIFPVGNAHADIYEDVKMLKKTSAKQKEDIKLLKLRLNKLEQMMRNEATSTSSAAKKPTSNEITYP